MFRFYNKENACGNIEAAWKLKLPEVLNCTITPSAFGYCRIPEGGAKDVVTKF